MSMWAKVKTTVTDLSAFQQAAEGLGIRVIQCSDHQVRGGNVYARLEGQGNARAYLIYGEKAGTYNLMMDSDVKYSPFAQQFGPNGGKVMRDYAAQVVQKQMAVTGSMISRQEQPDGSLVLQYIVR